MLSLATLVDIRLAFTLVWRTKTARAIITAPQPKISALLCLGTTSSTICSRT